MGQDEKQRLSYNLLMRLFGAVLDAYTRAVDRYFLDRAQIEDDKRRQWREHVHDRKRSPAQAREERRTDGAKPRPAPELFQQQRRPAKATPEPERPLPSEHSQAEDRERSRQEPDHAPPTPPVTKPEPPKRSWEELTALVERPPQRDPQGPKR